MPKWCAISWTTVIVDLVDDVVLGLADVADRLAVDHDPVRQLAAVLPAALGQREALVEPEQVRLVGVAVLDQDDDVVQQLHQLGRHLVERVGDELLELRRAGAASPAGRQRAALLVAGRALHPQHRALVQLSIVRAPA